MEMDSLQAPLLSSRDSEDQNDGRLEDDVGSGSTSVLGGGSGDEASPGLFMWLLTLSAGISGLLFGCMSLHCVVFEHLNSPRRVPCC